MLYPLVKAMHLIAMVAWFAGLFYLPRLLIYAVEARELEPQAREPMIAQLEVMARRLWRGITWPAMVATLFFGLWLAVLYGGWNQPWLHVKLSLVACLVAYHLACGRLRREVAARRPTWTSYRLRLWNELATVLLIAIVLVATLKNAARSWAIVAGVGGVIVVLALAVHGYRRARGRVTPPSTR